jgi:hypothetical protein
MPTKKGLPQAGPQMCAHHAAYVKHMYLGSYAVWKVRKAGRVFTHFVLLLLKECPETKVVDQNVKLDAWLKSTTEINALVSVSF